MLFQHASCTLPSFWPAILRPDARPCRPPRRRTPSGIRTPPMCVRRCSRAPATSARCRSCCRARTARRIPRRGSGRAGSGCWWRRRWCVRRVGAGGWGCGRGKGPGGWPRCGRWLRRGGCCGVARRRRCWCMGDGQRWRRGRRRNLEHRRRCCMDDGPCRRHMTWCVAGGLRGCSDGENPWRRARCRSADRREQAGNCRKRRSWCHGWCAG